jgi:hypothetical protein
MISAIRALMGLTDEEDCAVCCRPCHDNCLVVGSGETIRGRICGDCCRDYERRHGEPIERTAQRCRCNVLELVSQRTVQ